MNYIKELNNWRVCSQYEVSVLLRRYFSLDLYIQCNPNQIAGELFYRYKQNGASFVAQMVKKPTCLVDSWVQPWVQKIPQRRAWQPLSILAWRLPMDRGEWWATVYGTAKSWTQPKQLSTHKENDSKVYKER